MSTILYKQLSWTINTNVIRARVVPKIILKQCISTYFIFQKPSSAKKKVLCLFEKFTDHKRKKKSKSSTTSALGSFYLI